jgi:hypothetical protein
MKFAMKQKIAIIILFLACLALPQTFLSQTNSKAQKAAKTSKPKTDKGKLQAKKIMEQFIDGIFLERKVSETLGRLTQFDTCDKTDRDAIRQGCSASESRKDFGKALNSRIIAAGWNFEFQFLLLELGAKPIELSERPANSNRYNGLRDKVLKENSSAIYNLDIDHLDIAKIEKQLDEIEKNFADIEKLILAKTDIELYEKNVRIMRSKIKVDTGVIRKRRYYAVPLEGTNIGIILRSISGKLKIINFVERTYQ